MTARKINVIDLPGTYSLISRSPDEVVAMEVLRGLRKGHARARRGDCGGGCEQSAAEFVSGQPD